MTHGTPARRAWLLVVVAALAAGCTGTPAPTPTATSTATDAEPELVEELSAEREALADELASLRATLAGLDDALARAATGDRAALELAGRLLAADLEAASDADVARAAAAAGIPPEPVDGDPSADDDGADDDAPTADELAPLLPGPVTSRATTVSYGDLLTTTLAAARSAGSAGEPIARFLEAPVAGALGSWQRAPGDQLAAIAEAGRITDLEDATTAILELSGEAPRALAWVVHGLTTATPVEEVAIRATAHLAVIEAALEEVS